MNLISASLVKLAWRPAASRTLLLLAGLVLATYLIICATVFQAPDETARALMQQPLVFPGAIASLAGLVVVFAGIAAAAFGGVVAGSEWSWNTFRVALTRGESRARYVIGLFVALALLALAAWLVLYVLGTCVVIVAALVTGVSSGNPFAAELLGRHVAVIVAGWWAISMQLGLAFAISFVTHSTVTGIATVMGVTMGELIATAFIPMDVLQWAPFSAGNALVRIAAQSGLDPALVMPAAATTVYLVLALAVASLVARRSEVA